MGQPTGSEDGPPHAFPTIRARILEARSLNVDWADQPNSQILREVGVHFPEQTLKAKQTHEAIWGDGRVAGMLLRTAGAANRIRLVISKAPTAPPPLGEVRCECVSLTQTRIYDTN